MVPIFDSLAHPTLSGNWLGREKYANKVNFKDLSKELESNNFIGACAIGMADIENYSHQEFIQNCKNQANLIPIAGVNPHKENDLKQLKELGFKGIKIHPRFSKINLESDSDKVVKLLQEAGELNLTVFLCTYFACQLGDYPSSDPFYSIVRLLKSCAKTKVVLVHGGGVELMKYAELVRFNSNLLLDLSLTLMKYDGSSIDQDLSFLFNHFDRRICIGSDWPEYSLKSVREKVERLSKGVPIEKQEAYCFKNIQNFLEL